MASAVVTSDHRHFYCYSTLLMDIGGDAMRLIVDTFCEANDLSFHDFLSTYKEDLFHGRKSFIKSCCMCLQKSLSFGSGTFHDSQWEKVYILDINIKNGKNQEHSEHLPNQCPQRWMVNPLVELEQLEINFVADILYNVRPVLLHFLNDYMHHYGQTSFELFLNNKKHQLYHHYREEKCCLCSSQTRNNQDIKFSDNHWKGLFLKTGTCSNCSSLLCPAVFTARSISMDDIYLNVLVKVLTVTMPLFQLLGSIIDKRDVVYAHPQNDTKMDDQTFNDEFEYLSKSVLELLKEIGKSEVINEWKERIKLLKSAIPTEEEYHRLLNRIEEMETQNERRYQSIQKFQRQILNEATRKRTDNIKLTKSRIQDHRQGLRVDTKDVEKGKNIIGKNGILIYTGISGEGKTWHCLEVLSTINDKDIVQLDNMRLDISEWDTYIGADQKDTVVWIDDLKAVTVQNQKPFFERMHSQIFKRDIKVRFVISITRSELEKISEFELDLFKKGFTVSLGSDKSKEEDFEWKQHLLKEFMRCGIPKPESLGSSYPVTIVRDADDENLKDTPYKISDVTIKRIAKIETEIGFPECCRRFCSDPDLFKKGEYFFKYPSKSTKGQFTEMANHDSETTRRKFVVLCLLLFCPSTEQLDCIHNDVSKRLQYILDVKLDKRSYQRALKGLIPLYLIKDSRNKIRFQHETIRLALAITFCELDEEALQYFISNGPLDIVLDICRTEYQPQNPSSIVSLTVDNHLIFQRLVHEITQKQYKHSIRQIFWYLGTDNLALWTCFMKYVVENESIDKSTIEKIIKLNISNPAKVFGRENSQSGENSAIVPQDMFILRMVPIVDMLHHSVLFMFILRSHLSLFRTSYIFKILCIIISDNLRLLQVCSERLYFNNFNDVEDVLLYNANSDVNELINLFDITCRISMASVLFDLGEKIPSAYSVRELAFRVAKSLHSIDINSSFSGSFLSELRLVEDVSITNDTEVLRRCIIRASEMKDLQILEALRPVILRNQADIDMILKKASTSTSSSYYVSEVIRIKIEKQNVRTAVLKGICKDLTIFEMFGASDDHLLALLKQRFLTKEFSFNHICTSFPLLRDMDFSENKCCTVEQCFPGIGENIHKNVDCCIIMTEKPTHERIFLTCNNLPCFLFSICNYHFADLCFLEAFCNDSLEFLKAVDEIGVRRIAALSFFTRKLGRHIDDIFCEACKVGSHLMIRHLLEEDFEIKAESVSIGLKEACTKGHSLVVSNLLSWKPDMVPNNCLSDCLNSALINDQSQTIAYILTSEQVASYLKDGDTKGDDTLYKIIREAIKKCNPMYLLQIFSSFLSKGTLTGIALLWTERGIHFQCNKEVRE